MNAKKVMILLEFGAVMHVKKFKAQYAMVDMIQVLAEREHACNI